MHESVPDTQPPYVINIFSDEWVFTNVASFSGIVVFLIIAYFLYNSKYLTNSKFQSKLTTVIGVVILFRFLLSQAYQIYWGLWDIAYSLPFHLCGISGLAAGFALIRYNQSIYEFLLLLGAPGALWSFLTPQINILEPGGGFYNASFMYLDYFISHALIILAPLYLTFILKKRPRLLSHLKVFINSNIILIPIVGIINILIYYFLKYEAVNYMYLMAPPNAENPFVLGRWPWYIAIIEIASFLHMAFIYYLFIFIKFIKRSYNLKKRIA